MKKLIVVIAVLLLSVDRTVVQNAADSIRRNFQATAIRARAIVEG